MMWPAAWRILMRMYDIRPGAAVESRVKLEAELDWLDGMLADGRAYLAGDRFSRADITVASLLANFARPKEFPAQHDMKGPDALAATLERAAGDALGRRAVPGSSNSNGQYVEYIRDARRQSHT
jgi:glutathione S-transferase